jgi:hypothetical protein
MLLVLSALLGACASTPPVPVPKPACTQPPATDGAKDGGLGGTGNAPDPCAEQTGNS